MDKDIDTNIPVVFIGGHRKSGTTMFLNLFDNHPDLLVYPIDIAIFYAYYPEYIKPNYSDQQRLERINKVIFDELGEYGNISKTLDIALFREIFFTKINGKDLTNIGIILKVLLNSYQESLGAFNKKYFVVKETSLEIYATELFGLFQNAHFLHLIRDPRDNYAAIKAGVKRYSKFGDDEMTLLNSVLHRGLLGMKMAIENQKSVTKEYYKVIKFEDLVLKTKTILSEICEYLDIPYLDSLLIPTELGHATQGNNYDDINMYQVTANNIGRWKERIHMDEACIIEFYFKEVMESFGYDKDFPVSKTLKPVSNFYKWLNHRYFYFDRFV